MNKAMRNIMKMSGFLILLFNTIRCNISTEVQTENFHREKDYSASSTIDKWTIIQETQLLDENYQPLGCIQKGAHVDLIRTFQPYDETGMPITRPDGSNYGEISEIEVNRYLPCGPSFVAYSGDRYFVETQHMVRGKRFYRIVDQETDVYDDSLQTLGCVTEGVIGEQVLEPGRMPYLAENSDGSVFGVIETLRFEEEHICDGFVIRPGDTFWVKQDSTSRYPRYVQRPNEIQLADVSYSGSGCSGTESIEFANGGTEYISIYSDFNFDGSIGEMLDCSIQFEFILSQGTYLTSISSEYFYDHYTINPINYSVEAQVSLDGDVIRNDDFAHNIVDIESEGWARYPDDSNSNIDLHEFSEVEQAGFCEAQNETHLTIVHDASISLLSADDEDSFYIIAFDKFILRFDVERCQ